ncbi:uncharacterized protein EV420DRAFT_1639534 [Desarmillaria tabescens]|uniref:Uncharacterized protein n=1 Tax=Armillaria tabescens TaxID=1929756 RepID=A0AA39NB72_ARMTA|nr:uncharacterized protein EV420DRAFT_1639534 [Desarmillaria tabescens]KAK0462323.1 hypothetical protein EV420DRAFT_1639534 [Desarmillaria tabescens]
MNYNRRKKGGHAPVDIIDEASDEEEVRIRVPRSSQTYHHHMDYSSQVGSSGISVRTTAIAIQPGPISAMNTQDPPLPPPEPTFYDTSSLLAGLSGLSFLDPDYTTPAEVAHGVEEGVQHPRPLGISGSFIPQELVAEI